MKKCLALLLALLWVTVPSAQQAGSVSVATSNGTIDAADEAVTLLTKGNGSVAVQITGTFTATIQFEGTVNGSTWVALDLTPPDTTTAVSSATAAGAWVGSASGLREVRARVSSYTSGTPVVTIRVTPFGGGSGAGGAAGGNDAASATGAAVPASADYIGVNISGTLTGVTGLAVGTAKAPTVAIVDASGNQVTSFGGSGGTSVAEDVASANADLGTPAYAVRKATPANTSGLDGDYEPLQISAGRLWVSAVVDAALPAGTNAIGKLAANSGVDIGDVDVTSVIPGTGATNAGKAVDSVAGATDTGTAALGIRDDALTTLTPVDGDYANLRLDANGRLWANIFGTTQAAATYLTVRLSDGSGFLTPGTDYTEDVASAGAEAGPLVMTIRQDTPAGTTSLDGDYQNLKTDSVGRLWINCGTGCSGGTQYADGVAWGAGNTGTSALAVRKDAAGAFTGVIDGDWSPMQLTSAGSLRVDIGTSAINVSESGGALTALQLIDNIVSGSGVNVSQINGVAPSMNAGANGTGVQRVTLATDDAAVTALQVIDDAQTGDSVSYRVSVGTTEDETEIKATAGRVFSVAITNTNAAARYFRCYNLTAANTTPGTSTVFFSLAVPGNTAGAGFTHTFGPNGIAFSTALTCTLTTGAADTDVAEVAANELRWVISYK